MWCLYRCSFVIKMKKAIKDIIKILKQDSQGWETIVSGFFDVNDIAHEDCEIINTCSKWYLGKANKKRIEQIFEAAKDEYEYDYDEGQEKLDFIIDILFDEILEVAFRDYEKNKK